MDNGQPALAINVGVGIQVAGHAVGSPADMPQADKGLGIEAEQNLLQIIQFAFFLENLKLAVNQQSHAGAVIAPIFHPLQAFQDNGQAVLFA